MSIKSRQKGNNYELSIVKRFKELGWGNACSSRSESKNTDDKGIDLCYTDPFQIQAKAWESAPSYHKVLAKMPDVQGKYNLIFHKRNNQGTVVVMKEETFLELLEMIMVNKIIEAK